jgi:hypothetical protein
MPIAPRVTRGQARPGHVREDLPPDDPRPALLVLRWQGRTGRDAVELVPGHMLATTGFPHRPPEACLVRWWYDAGAEHREDWFRAGDVLDHQPSAEEWRELVDRPAWMS